MVATDWSVHAITFREQRDEARAERDELLAKVRELDKRLARGGHIKALVETRDYVRELFDLGDEVDSDD